MHRVWLFPVLNIINVVCRDGMKIHNNYVWLSLSSPILITEIGILVFISCILWIPSTASRWCQNTCNNVSVSRRVHGLILLQAPVDWKQNPCSFCGVEKDFFFISFICDLLQTKTERETRLSGARHFDRRCYGNDRRTLTGVQRCVVASASCSASCPLLQSSENMCWASGWHVIISWHRAQTLHPNRRFVLCYLRSS